MPFSFYRFGQPQTVNLNNLYAEVRSHPEERESRIEHFVNVFTTKVDVPANWDDVATMLMPSVRSVGTTAAAESLGCGLRARRGNPLDNLRAALMRVAPGPVELLRRHRARRLPIVVAARYRVVRLRCRDVQRTSGGVHPDAGPVPLRPIEHEAQLGTALA